MKCARSTHCQTHFGVVFTFKSFFFALCRNDSLYHKRMTPISENTRSGGLFRVMPVFGGVAWSASGASHHVKSTLSQNHFSIFLIMRKGLPSCYENLQLTCPNDYTVIYAENTPGLFLRGVLWTCELGECFLREGSVVCACEKKTKKLGVLFAGESSWHVTGLSHLHVLAWRS